MNLVVKYLNAIWAGVYDQQTAAGNCDVFYENLQAGIVSYFPKTISVHSSDKPWMTKYVKHVKSLISERQQVFHREGRYRSRRWKRLRNKIHREIFKAKKEQ